MTLLFDHFRTSAPRSNTSARTSPHFWPNHIRLPDGPEWDKLRDDDLRDYRLKVHGMVEPPSSCP